MSGIDGYDWSVFGGNPVPGDPESVRLTAGRLADLASEAGTQNRLVRAVGEDSRSVWEGTAADLFRPHVDRLIGQIDKLVTSYETAASAMQAYSARLHDAQDLAVQALMKAHAAAADITQARAALASSSYQLSQAAASYNQAVQAQAAGAAGAAHPDGARAACPDGAQTACPDAARVAGLQAEYQASQRAADAARNSLRGAQADLAAAEEMKNHAVQMAHAAAAALADGLRSAGAEGIQNPHRSWFSSLVGDIEGVARDSFHWLGHNWAWVVPGGAEVMLTMDGAKWFAHNWVQVLKSASGVLGGVATAAGFLAIVPGVGEIALPVALIASGLATGDDTVLAATGNGKWSTVGLDVVGDAGFGAGEMLGRAADGVEEADRIFSDSEEVKGAMGLLREQAKPYEQAAARWDSQADREVIQVGNDGQAVVTKGADMANQVRADAGLIEARISAREAQLAKNAEKLSELPGRGDANSFGYALKTLKPGEENNTYSKIARFVKSPSQYADAILHPPAEEGPAAVGGIRRITAQATRDALYGPAATLRRITIGVGAAGTGFGTYVDKLSWQDALGR